MDVSSPGGGVTNIYIHHGALDESSDDDDGSDGSDGGESDCVIDFLEHVGGR